MEGYVVISALRTGSRNVVFQQLKSRVKDAGLLKQQDIAAGAGPVIERRYSVSVPTPRGKSTFAILLNDPGKFSPSLIASFESTTGSRQVDVGDTFDINLSAPLVAPVVVSVVGTDWFELATLEGHPEAGTIRFGLDGDRGEFYIHSIARSGFPVFHFLYLKIGIMKWIQTRMWVAFCRNFAEKCGLESSVERVIQVSTHYPGSSLLEENETFPV